MHTNQAHNVFVYVHNMAAPSQGTPHQHTNTRFRGLSTTSMFMLIQSIPQPNNSILMCKQTTRTYTQCQCTLKLIQAGAISVCVLTCNEWIIALTLENQARLVIQASQADHKHKQMNHSSVYCQQTLIREHTCYTHAWRHSPLHSNHSFTTRDCNPIKHTPVCSQGCLIKATPKSEQRHASWR